VSPFDVVSIVYLSLLFLTNSFPHCSYAQQGRHREPWVSLGALRDSQAALLSFTIELSKKLDIWYSRPPVPVNLKFLDDIHKHGGIEVADAMLRKGLRHQRSRSTGGLNGDDIGSPAGSDFSYGSTLLGLQDTLEPVHQHYQQRQHQPTSPPTPHFT